MPLDNITSQAAICNESFYIIPRDCLSGSFS